MLSKHLLIITFKKHYSFRRLLFFVLIVDLQTFLKVFGNFSGEKKIWKLVQKKNHSRQGLSADISSSIL